MHELVPLQPSAAVMARLNVALGLSQNWLRELLRTGRTRLRQRNEPIKFVAVEMFVEWPCQNLLLLLIRLRREKSFTILFYASAEAAVPALAKCSRTQRVSRKMTASTPFAVSFIVAKAAIALALIPCR
jgi:hypothetical protein